MIRNFKRIFIFAIVLLGIFFMSSCEKNITQDDQVSVVLTYTINSDNGISMYGTRASNAEIFDDFYQEIMSGLLVAPSYNLTFTEKTTGAVYEINGKWENKDMITLRPGTYRVEGTSTAEGGNIQEKCSLVIADEVTIDSNSKSISLTADYDCALIVFSDASIESMSNFNGISSEPFYKFQNYIYAFVKHSLYDEGHSAESFISGKHTDDTAFRIFTGCLSFEKGKYYVYTDVSTAFNLAQMDEGGTGDGIDDLSISGTANCYIVSAPGAYKFNATVKGNSNESVGTPASVAVLWESFGNDVKPNVGDIIQSVNLSNGYVILKTPEILNNGNAVIAVKDASGSILWSWHIWVCKDYDPVITQQRYISGFIVMDRNLGALNVIHGDAQCAGLLYQWGRKDPFLGGDGIDHSDAPASSTVVWPTKVPCSSVTGTVLFSTNNPMTFIYDYSHWMNENRTDLWDEEKTTYDPCPQGWKVCPKAAWNNFPMGYSKHYSKEEKGGIFDSPYSTPEAYYPRIQRITEMGTYRSLEDTEGVSFWTATGDSIGMGTDSQFNFWSPAKAEANSVRCCKE